jgi:2-methylisocitrate lyase-like PEP mutase family enzyme
VRNQERLGSAFRALHQRSYAFILPNPYDVGTARLLAHLGFEALATTSAGHAFSLGRCDNSIGRDAMLAHAAAIAAAIDLPVSGDLENGYGDTPKEVAETIRLAAQAGLVGASIEDATNRLDDPIYARGLAADRLRAAAETAHALPFPFTLTARCENYLVGRPNLFDTIARLQAYQEAGADVLYAPGITRREDLATLVASVDRPVNVVMGLQGAPLDLAELSQIGVRRVSVGSALSRAALGAFLRAAQEMLERGSFEFADSAASYAELSAIFEP